MHGRAIDAKKYTVCNRAPGGILSPTVKAQLAEQRRSGGRGDRERWGREGWRGGEEVWREEGGGVGRGKEGQRRGRGGGGRGERGRGRREKRGRKRKEGEKVMREITELHVQYLV